MNFDRITEQQAYEEVQRLNSWFRQGHITPKSLYEYLSQLGVDRSRSVLVGLQPVDADVFAGTVVRQDGRIFSFVYSESEHNQNEWTEMQPPFVRIDTRSPIAMALLIFKQESTAGVSAI